MFTHSAVPPTAECVLTLLRSLVGGDAQGSALRTLQDGMDEIQRHMGAPWRRYPFMRLLKGADIHCLPQKPFFGARARACRVGWWAGHPLPLLPLVSRVTRRRIP